MWQVHTANVMPGSVQGPQLCCLLACLDCETGKQSCSWCEPLQACLDAVVEVHQLADVFVIQLSGVRVRCSGK